MDFRILGPLELRGRDGPVELGGRRERVVLAALLLERNRVVQSDRLAEALWSDDQPATASTALQGAVSRLRKALSAAGEDGREILRTERGGYLLRVSERALDLARFEQHAREGRDALARGRPDVASERLEAALAEWRGPPLADLRYEPFAQDAIARLEELRLVALEARIESDLALGRHSEVAPELESLVRAHPLRERLWSQLMLSLYRSGRQADALSAYRRARETLVNELGIEPSAELRALNTRILTQDPSLSPSRPPATPGNLPRPVTPLVGRQDLLETLQALVLESGARLVTLLGPGGSGKSRLALELGADLAPAFPDGVFLAPLAALSDPALVLPTIAQTLGVKEAAGEPIAETLVEAIREKRVLLIVDNFEQLLPAGRDLSFLVERTSGLTIVVTSRAALRVGPEHRLEVSPLAVPSLALRTDPAALLENDAVRLFVSRVRAVEPRFKLTPDNAAAVADICVRLDGLPLALELAAARTSLLSLRSLAAKLDDRLAVLTGGPRDRPLRQQTLRATLAWSYDLLDEVERSVFRKLAVFAGGWTLEAAESVAGFDGTSGGASVDAIDSLVEKSLVRRIGDDLGEERFSMLETVREYAADCLRESGEEEAARGAHARIFLEFAEQADPEITMGPVQAVWHGRLAAEHDNLRAALAFFRDRGIADGELRLAGALARFWLVRGYLAEGRTWLEGALAGAPDAPAEVRARALRGAGPLAAMQGDTATARTLLEESVALYRALGETKWIARSIGNLGIVAMMEREFDRARGLFHEALDLMRSAGDDMGIPIQLLHLGYVAHAEGDHDEACDLCRQALDLFRELQDDDGLTSALFNLGLAELARGATGEAYDSFRESLRLALALGYREKATACLVGFAAVFVDAGDDAEAARLLGVVETALEAGAAPLDPAERELYERTAAALAARPDADRLGKARRAGASTAVAEAAQQVLARTSARDAGRVASVAAPDVLAR